MSTGKTAEAREVRESPKLYDLGESRLRITGADSPLVPRWLLRRLRR